MANLIAQVFEHTNFEGQYRWIVSNVSDMRQELGFNDNISSIIVFSGCDYKMGDVIRFYEHNNFNGGHIELTPGEYPNIHIQPLSFGDRISSAQIMTIPESTSNRKEVYLRVRLFEHTNFEGQFRDILESEENLNNLGFNDAASSIRIFKGCDYTSGWVCRFFEHTHEVGGILQPGLFGPETEIPDINATPHSFSDRISSVQIFFDEDSV